jgi:hypothetical protein
MFLQYLKLLTRVFDLQVVVGAILIGGFMVAEVVTATHQVC